MSGSQILVVLAASVLGAFVKAVTGMGFPLLAVPLATLAVGVEDAVVVVVLPNMVANALLCVDARDGRGEARDLARILVPATAATVIGTVALVNLPEAPVLLALVASIALFLVTAIAHPELRLDPGRATRWSPVVGGVTGIMQGATGVSGPIVAGWFHGYRLPTQTFVYTVTMIFGLTGLVQVGVLGASGEFTGQRLVVSALALVPVLAMLPLGRALRARLAGPRFEAAVLCVIAASAVAIVVRLVA